MSPSTGSRHPNISPDGDRQAVLTFGFAPPEDSSWLPCPYCGQPVVEETDGTHCGGCAITWWEGLR
jgi:hypothetical protein